MTIQAATRPGTAPVRDADSLPSAVRVLAVTARPFQESADLGGPLYAFRRSGSSLSLLCLTRGEGSTPNSGHAQRLEAARPWEVQMASLILGIGRVTVASYRDGSLHHHTTDLARRIERAIGEYSADLLLVVAPETGDVGDAAVARAATAGAARAGIPAVARTRPGVSGSWTLDLGRDAEVARAIQKAAAAAHATQWEALPELASQLDQLGSVETLRWLRSPVSVPAQYARPDAAS